MTNTNKKLEVGDRVEISESCCSFLNGKPRTGRIIDHIKYCYGIELDDDPSLPVDATKSELTLLPDNTNDEHA
tara:strand:+ start:970 stop:1188 length:219 start_codon:yes stop_codon:yes gene_type:complete